ncbi:AraC family transcriptional regulator N-terminal domain-containing protein [Microbacterium sp. RD1]|uniref:AraC family transcriptional regulator n=1 Tax=Microbacterium sp. RD1 TaxID=3457313 RepID=UPI003FA5EAA3
MSVERLRTLIERNARSEITALSDRVHISRIDRTGPPEFSSTGSLFVLLVQGAKELVLGDRAYTYRDGDALIAPLDLPTTGSFIEASEAAPSLGFSMALQSSVIAELLLDPAAQTSLSPRAATTSLAGLSVFRASEELVDATTRRVGLAERPQDEAVLAPLVEREIHWLLLRGPAGPLVRQLGLAGSRLTRLGETVRWLQDHYREAVRVEDLARMSAMSPSAFHRAFLQVTALSPIQFQKQLRLQHARARLLVDSTDVAGVAHDVGYESASQFSRDYRARFGAPPREHARWLRTVDV